MNLEDTIVVFTARSRERILREGGSQAWVLNPARARQCTWLLCTQNQHHPNRAFADADAPHGMGFLLGKISAIRPSQEEGVGHRWMIEISQYAEVAYPDAWDHGRNPVRYTSLESWGISREGLTLQPVQTAAHGAIEHLSAPRTAVQRAADVTTRSGLAIAANRMPG